MDSYIDNFTKIEDKTVRVKIGEKAEIRRSIIGRHSTINFCLKKIINITSLSVVSDEITIASGCNVKATRVSSFKLPSGEYFKKNHTIIHFQKS